MTIVWNLIKAFLVGGALCMIGEILLLKTKLTPARILVGYVTAGVIMRSPLNMPMNLLPWIYSLMRLLLRLIGWLAILRICSSGWRLRLMRASSL